MNARPVFELTLPLQTPSNNDIKNMHFRDYKRVREMWCEMVRKALAGRLPDAPLERVRIEIDRYCSGTTDWDNALGGIKPLMDCLTLPSKSSPSGLGLIRDDNPSVVLEAPRMRQLKASPGKGRTVVRIYDASNDDKFKNDNNDNND